ncbi:hypothetical protein F8388_010782 [Cannabis sativa]|uniref:Uncharacterized protein n=1 Tax=Cannabis sativa TaxID=3483 RepID=A0A7J6HE31_CANSA|nr:hypothetical protein G4B88_020169 [Cannabis sativa]KAF4392759.1 hypothetical protein F8388_010782 [Cannabis sativa]
MGCSTSKLEDEEAVQLCKDRKRFIKQAVEQRAKFASGHLAYIQSLKRVSAALRDYIEGEHNEPHDFLLESFITPPFTPVKKTSPGFISISPKSFVPAQIQSHPSSTIKVNYLRSGGNRAVSVEERPQTPERVRVESYPPMEQQYGFDGYFPMQSSSSMNPSSSFSYSPNRSSNLPPRSPRPSYLRSGGNRAVSVEEMSQSPGRVRVESYPPMEQYGFDGFFSMQSSSPMNPSIFSFSPNRPSNLPPNSPQNSQWDFFWNPFSSLDYYGYPNRASLDQQHTIVDDDISGLRQLREEEGIPDLEDDDIEQKEPEQNANVIDERTKSNMNRNIEDEVIVEDVDENEEDDDDDEEEESECECDCDCESEIRAQNPQHGRTTTIEVSRSQTARQVVETSNQEVAGGGRERKDETPGFTVYVNRRPTSMAEVIKELEDQFMVVCSAANEVSSMLEANKAQYSSSSNELTVKKILNPVALIRSASSRSSSSRFIANSSSSSREETEESSSSDFSEECMFSGSHQSTLDRLYAWEKKLFDEVKSGEKVRIAYEKKCNQLRNQDVKGDDPSSVDKTRAIIRDLHTQIKVSIHSVEAISKRIETLRDEELQPQLLELVKGLSRMWKVMAECHQSQKRTLDEAKLLLAGTPSKLDSRKHSFMSVSDPQRVARSAANLESELRNWRGCFESWIASQRSYVHALSGWLLRCVRSDPDTSKIPFSPRRSAGALPIFGLCIQWSRSMDASREAPVLDGLDFFAAGMGSLYAQQQQREDSSRRVHLGSKRFSEEIITGNNMEVVEIGGGEVEDVMTAEKMAEVAIRVLCAGMSVAMSSLSEFSNGSAKAYAELINQWETAQWPPQNLQGRVGV